MRSLRIKYKMQAGMYVTRIYQLFCETPRGHGAPFEVYARDV